MKLAKEKGITLIALVITIIVLLILAGVSIAMLTGSNGVLTKATQAQVDNARGEASDKINTALNGVYTILLSNDYTDFSSTSSSLKASDIITGNGLDKNEYIVSTSNAGTSETKVVSIYWIPGGATLAESTVTLGDANTATRYKGYIEGSIEIKDDTKTAGEGKYAINSASISQTNSGAPTLSGTDNAVGASS